MWVGVITLFPEMFQAISASGITRRAIESGIVELECWNPRDFTTDKHRTVDDKPYGGGPGMLMKVSPLKAALSAARTRSENSLDKDQDNEKSLDEVPRKLKRAKVIYLSPQGKTLDQQTLAELAKEPSLILIAGRYEGVDERLIDQEVDEEYSIGDYVLSGGELPAMVLIDGITRLQPGAVGDAESVVEDSFVAGLLDHPHYTRPEVVDGVEVPEVLLSGNHKAIDRWRLKQRLGRTFKRRPDLLTDTVLTEDLKELLDEYLKDTAEDQ